MSENCCRTAEDGAVYCTLPVSGNDHKLWRKFRSGIMFGVACITSPCCTPLLVPLVLGLMAGTPIAAWLANYIGWLYAGLTLLSIVSLVLGLRWAKHNSSSPRLSSGVRSIPQSEHPLILPTTLKEVEP
jgi:hypothetical protein